MMGCNTMLEYSKTSSKACERYRGENWKMAGAKVAGSHPSSNDRTSLCIDLL